MGVLLLTHAHERLSVSVIAAHDVSTRREHALDLPILAILAIDDLRVLTLRVHVLTLASKVVAASGLGSTRLFKLPTIVTSDSLTTGTEESFHTV